MTSSPSMLPVSGERIEYRLRWQRVGLPSKAAIFQTEFGATEKATRMLALDETKHDHESSGFRTMPDLVWMRLERRVVGDWSADCTFNVPEPEAVPS